MRTINDIIEDIEALTESAQVDSKSHSRHEEFLKLLEELRQTIKEKLDGKTTRT